MAGYRELRVWRFSMRLATDIYRLTEGYPDNEKYGLVSQLRRAAVSVPSNIAEGHARNSPKEMIRFAGIALGSTAEIETPLLISQELGYVAQGEANNLLKQTDDISRVLHGLIRSNRSDS